MNSFPTPDSGAVQPLATTAAPVDNSDQIDNLTQAMSDWHAANETLAAAKKAESELRKKLSKCQVWDAEKTTGSQTYRPADAGWEGWQLKLVRKESVSVQNKNGEAAVVFNQIAAISPASAERVKRLFKFNVSMSEKVYREELTEYERSLVDPLLTRKPSTPSLELKPPKE